MSAIATLIRRNITNVAQLITVPEGATKVRLNYTDSGTAGNLRFCCEYASAFDAAHRLSLLGAHVVIKSSQQYPGIALSGITGIYAMTDNALGGGSNTLSLFFEVE